MGAGGKYGREAAGRPGERRIGTAASSPHVRWVAMFLAGLRLAVTLLTAIPLPGGKADWPPSRPVAGAAMTWAPGIGLLLGAAAALVLYAFQQFWHAGPLLGATLAIVTLAALTRCLHLDGLADLADGLGSRKPADQALDIMRRSDIGPFGVATLVLTVLLQLTALTQADALGRGVPAVLTAAVTGRLAITWACRTGVPPARGEGLGALVAGTVHPAIPAALSAAALAGAAAYNWIFAVAVGAGLAASVAVTWLAVRRLGGITGDVLGALTEIATAISLVVLALS
ncbi:MAG TPA: adenosylcobinamide-GDP ribazoletransferase [Streptosporangiaceae bacterium]|nr:adenosylcobinamide-GDP ribazoletransferase [Streptosporangiaceae bacterium]